MRFRRRYQVVVEGISGQATSMRSVISEHRSEAEAREAADLERSRLEVIHGGAASSWRILVMLDDETVAEVHPQAEGEDLLRARPLTPPPEAAAGPPAEEPGDAEAAAPDAADEPVPSPAEAEPPPEGPVPDWVIQRFEDSIARRGEREDKGPEGEEDGAG